MFLLFIHSILADTILRPLAPYFECASQKDDPNLVYYPSNSSCFRCTNGIYRYSDGRKDCLGPDDIPNGKIYITCDNTRDATSCNFDTTSTCNPTDTTIFDRYCIDTATYEGLLSGISTDKEEIYRNISIGSQIVNQAIKNKYGNLYRQYQYCQQAYNFMQNQFIFDQYSNNEPGTFSRVFDLSASPEKDNGYPIFTDIVRDIKQFSEGYPTIQQYEYNSIITIDLFRYSWDGIFKGITPLTVDFQFCGQKNEIKQTWRKFGSNTDSQCVIDLYELLQQDGSNDIYEPYLEDVDPVNNSIKLRMIPIMLNWGGLQNERWVRRFYLFDDISTKATAYYATNVSLLFMLKIDDKQRNRLYTPQLNLTYVSIPKASILPNADLHITKPNGNGIVDYSFQVRYTMDYGEWELGLTAAFSLGIIISVLFWILRMAIGNYNDGLPKQVILAMVGNFILYVTMGLFIVSFSMSFFTFIFFKWQKAVYYFLAVSQYFDRYMNVVPWCMFGFMCLAVLCKVAAQLNHDIIIVDWETPNQDGMPVSAWRRINVANEWNRILTVRSYSTMFSLIVSTFILSGFSVDLLSQPIPSNDLIEVAKPYKLLRFAFSSFIWLLLMLFQYLWSNMIYWPIWGNPFYNFLDLCTTSNISILLTTSASHGYYLHGRSVHSHADAEMKRLSQNLYDEGDGLVGLRGLLPNTAEQVFECFFTTAFTGEYRSMIQAIDANRQFNFTQNKAANIDANTLASYNQVNSFLKGFFDGSNKSHRFTVKPPSVFQLVFGKPDQMTEESLFVHISDSAYRTVLLSGIEWTIYLLYLTAFAALDMQTNEPCIAAFLVYCLDIIIVKGFSFFGNRILGKKSLIDGRFLL